MEHIRRSFFSKDQRLFMVQTVTVTPPVAAPATLSTHCIATLIGFQSQQEACIALANGNFVDLPQSLFERYRLWNIAYKNSRKPPKHRRDYCLPTVKSLPLHLQSFEEELKSRPTYKRHYENVAEYRVVLVPVCHLITPQWFADLDYIAVIKQTIPQPGNLEEALALVFKEEDDISSPLPAPNNNGSIITFRRPAKNLRVTGTPQIDMADPHKTKITIEVETPGNYLQVCEINGMFVIVNGVHRCAAFLDAGWDYIPCLLRKANSIYDSGLFQFGSQGILHEPQTMERPPFICHLFDADVAPRFQQVNTDQLLQIVFQFNPSYIPRELQEIVTPLPAATQRNAQSAPCQ